MVDYFPFQSNARPISCDRVKPPLKQMHNSQFPFNEIKVQHANETQEHRCELHEKPRGGLSGLRWRSRRMMEYVLLPSNWSKDRYQK